MKYILIILCAQMAIAQDEVEDRWNSIYQQYYSQAMSDGEWAQIAGEKINESYGVQDGDTLWDISITLFGNGYYWPKIWQLNSSITNPHIISPGYELRFTPGTTDAPPTLQIAAGPDVPSTQGTPGAPSTATSGTAAPGQPVDPNAPQYTSVPVIPPPTIKSRPVLMKIPNSLPYLVASKKENNFDPDGFSFAKSEKKIPKSSVFLHTYIAEEAPIVRGTILEAEGERSVASLFQYVYISIPDGAVGQRYVSYKKGESIDDPDSIFGNAGFEIQIEGEIELVELVNASRNLFKGMVKKIINPVRVGSYVKEGRIESIDTTITDNFAKVSGQVLGGEYDGTRKILGLDSLVYFNVGEENGVEVGQMMRILKREKNRKDTRSLVLQEEDPIAVAKIVSVTPKRSTGIVLKTSMEIVPGDYAGDNTFNAVDASEVENELKSESLNLKEEQEAKSNQSDSDIDAQEDAEEAADVPQDDEAVQEELDQAEEEEQSSDEDSDTDLDEEEILDEEE